MATIGEFEFPDELFYLVEHDTWVCRGADDLATIGITPLGAHISGEFIDFMPKPLGTRIERDRALGVLEMSKVIRSVRAPITGTIVAINEKVKTHPKLINDDPYGAGWLVRMRAAAWQKDVQLLVTGMALPAAVGAYMDTLAVTFGKA